jgi:hypothetical protein
MPHRRTLGPGTGGFRRVFPLMHAWCAAFSLPCVLWSEAGPRSSHLPRCTQGNRSVLNTILGLYRPSGHVDALAAAWADALSAAESVVPAAGISWLRLASTESVLLAAWVLLQVSSHLLSLCLSAPFPGRPFLVHLSIRMPPSPSMWLSPGPPARPCVIYPSAVQFVRLAVPVSEPSYLSS